MNKKQNRTDSTLLYWAWTIIANAHEGNWENATPEWRDGATSWRDAYHVWLDKQPKEQRKM